MYHTVIVNLNIIIMLLLPRHNERVVNVIIIVIVIINVNVTINVIVIIMLLLPRHKQRVVNIINIIIVIIIINIIISLVAQAQGASCQLQGAGNEKSGRRQVSLNNWGQDLISQKIVIRIVIVIVKDYYHNYNGVKI